MNTSWIWYLIVGLLAVNYISGGAVMNRLGGNSGLVAAGECYYGVNFWNPVVNLGGLVLPVPSIDDAALAIAITTSLIWILNRLKKGPKNWKQKLYLLALVWLGIRTLAVYLMLAIPGCAAYAAHSNAVMNPIQGVLIAAGVLLLARWFIGGKQDG